MRASRPTSIALAATAFVILGALAPLSAQAQQPKAPPPAQAPQEQQGEPALAAPKPYKPVAVKLPQTMNDPSFVAFRKQLEGIVQKKDRAALARLVARNFFWMPADKDTADKRKSGIDNLANAIGLESADAPGWDLLADLAIEPTAEPYAPRQGVICAPGEASFDENAAEELATATETDATEWGYPAADGVQVRSGPQANSPVIERLGLYLVRSYPDDSPASAVQGDTLRIVTPSGKLGFIPADMLRPLITDQVCYGKEGNAWKITGVIGGASDQAR